METDVSVSIEAFELVQHVLTVGYAAMGSALLYFILTKNDNAPQYRMSSVLSVVVMISAFILLFQQQQSWAAAYAFNGQEYVLRDGAELFTNGYRYLNWLIDVPHLLIQILFVASIVGAARYKYIRQFILAGGLMVITGYVGQFYEPGRLNEDIAAWLIWGTISTVFYIWVLVLITQVIRQGKANMSGSKAQRLFGAILPLFYFSWTLYPGAYLFPILIEWGVAGYEFSIVAQQITFNIADVTSNIFYGVMLNIVSTKLSEEQGYKPS